LPIPDLTASRFDALLASKEGALAAESLNKLRARVSQMFVYASMPGGPCEGRPNPIAAVPKRKVVKKPHEILRLEEVPKVLAEIPDRPNARTAARGELSRCLNPRAVCACALYTGMRKGELGGLRKIDVDLIEGTIRVCNSWDAPRTKDGKFALIPIAPGLRPYLEAALRDAPGELVFPAEDGSMMPTDVDLKGMLQRAMGRAGVVVGYEARCRRHGCGFRERRRTSEVGECPKCGYQLWAKPIPRHVRFHDTRHSCATLLLKDGVPLATVQKILRHSDPKITSEIYGHLEIEDMRRGVDRLDFGPAQVAPTAPPLALAANDCRAATSAQQVRNLASEELKPATRSNSSDGSLASMVGATGFEPATTCAQGRCATRLRYAP
jgi:integrase